MQFWFALSAADLSVGFDRVTCQAASQSPVLQALAPGSCVHMPYYTSGAMLQCWCSCCPVATCDGLPASSLGAEVFWESRREPRRCSEVAQHPQETARQESEAAVPSWSGMEVFFLKCSQSKVLKIWAGSQQAPAGWGWTVGPRFRRHARWALEGTCRDVGR